MFPIPAELKTPFDSDGDGLPNTIAQLEAQFKEFHPQFSHQLRTKLGPEAVILGNAIGRVADPNLNGITIEMLRCADNLTACGELFQLQEKVAAKPSMSVMWLDSQSVSAAEQCHIVAHVRESCPFVLPGTDFYDGSHVVCAGSSGLVNRTQPAVGPIKGKVKVPRPLQELYPVFWDVGGGPAAVAKLLPGGSLDVSQYGIKPGNWTHTGGFGAWPTIQQDGSVSFGGVPQATNLTLFFEVLTAHIETQMPDPAFAGLGVFDFESWTPVWEENTQPPLPPSSTPANDPGWHSDRYRMLSRQLVMKANPSLNATQVEARAKAEFETAALNLFVSALTHAAAVRPKVLWGFYGFPQSGCAVGTWLCPYDTRQQKKLLPLWQASGALYPSIYESDSTETDAYRLAFMNQTVGVSVLAAEAAAGGSKRRIPVYPFAWECYHNGSTLLSPTDLKIDMINPYNSGADGLVVWGSMDAPCQLEPGCGGDRVAAWTNNLESFEQAEPKTPVVLHEITCCTQCARSWCGAAVTFAKFDSLHIKGEPLCDGSNASAKCVKCSIPCNVTVYRTSTGARYAAFDETAPPCPGPAPTPPSKYFDFIKTHTGPLIEKFEKRVHACSQSNCNNHGRCNTVDATAPGASGSTSGCSCFDGYSGPACATLDASASPEPPPPLYPVW